MIDPCCHGNEIWDKMGDNSAPLRENCTLFAPTPYFLARAIRWCHLIFFPANPCCHGDKFWDKIGYNSAPVKDNCSLFAPTPLFSGPRYPMVSFKFLPCQPPLPWQRILEHMGQNSAYIRDISKVFASDGVLSRSVYFSSSAQLLKKHTHPRKNHTLNIRKIVIILQQKHLYIF